MTIQDLDNFSLPKLSRRSQTALAKVIKAVNRLPDLRLACMTSPSNSRQLATGSSSSPRLISFHFQSI